MPPAFSAFGDPLADDDDAFTGPLPGDFLHLHAGDLCVAPVRVVMPAQPLHGRPQRLGHDVALAQLPQCIEKLAAAKCEPTI